MTTSREVLLKVLESLTTEDFKRFKWFLKGSDTEDSSSPIPEARLERADRLDTVDLMVQTYGCPGAGRKSARILEKIPRNDLVLELRDLKNPDSDCLKGESSTNKARLVQLKADIQLMIQERQKMIGQIHRSAELSRISSARQTADTVQVFTDLKRSVESSLARVVQQIEEKQRTTQKQAEAIIQKLEQDISQLSRRAAELEALPHPEDPLSPPLHPPKEEGLPQPSYGTVVMSTVKELRDKLNAELDTFLRRSKLNRVRQFAGEVTLDPDTAHPGLVLSEDGRQVHCGQEQRNLPDGPGRFSSAANVLGQQGISTGRLYFEVRVRGKSAWDVGVVKESICRKGSITAHPRCGYWTIGLRDGRDYKASGVHLPVGAPPDRVGVFVEYEKGSVSFYNVDSSELIHSFTNCSFTEKLYPFFSPGSHRNGQNSAPLVISPVSNTD